MAKIHTSPLLLLFPWLSPYVITFVFMNGGIEVQLWRNGRLLRPWHPSQLHHVLPEPLCQWITGNHIYEGSHPYPLIKQLWQYLLAVASKKLVIDSSIFAKLEEVSQPPDFALVWTINSTLEWIEGRYEGADGYLGMGWFYRGTKVWSLNHQQPGTIDVQLKQLILPIERADFLLHSTIPYLQSYLPTLTDFQLITDFAVQILVSDAHYGGLTLTLKCNYPQLLSTILVPRQKINILIAHRAIIRFPHRALTPALIHLFQAGNFPITLQGTSIPHFITEQLPVLRQFRLINDEMATKIMQSHPIVPITTLTPTFSMHHRYENGVGLYGMNASYRYQQHTLDMNALLAAFRQNTRFIEQYNIWFEWPFNGYASANTIQQSLTIQLLCPEEVMRFDTRRIARVSDQMPAPDIHPEGSTPIEQVHSLFEQLRFHGIPGGIIGESKGLVSMFATVCDKLLLANQEAQILWLVPWDKIGPLTRSIHHAIMSSSVTVASIITLRDEPQLISRSWTLVIFQELDLLLDGSPQSRLLAQLKWLWALLSITSEQAIHPSIMQILHLPEQYFEPFRTWYLFDLEKSYQGSVSNHQLPILSSSLSAPPVVPKEDETPHRSIGSPPVPVTQTPHITMHFNQGVRQQPEHPLVQPAASTPMSFPANEVKRTEQKFDSIPSVQERISVMQQYWHFFNQIHERQETGMKPLWGLVEDSRAFDFEHRFSSHEPYQFQLYMQLLPSPLLAQIEMLWGTCMIPRCPDRIISEPFPHKLFAETFGLALKFWHGCSLTAWFFCEGPSSRTDLSRLAEYYYKDVQALKEMGTPVDQWLFEKLAKAEEQLGQPQPFNRQIATFQGENGITTTSMRTYGTRRKGFEILRDIISFYRRQWAEKYLEQYLQMRWETEIHEIAHSYKLTFSQKGVPPTIKQFAKDAKAVTNHWFGGNLSEVYRAIQERSPLQPHHVAFLPANRAAFAFAVFSELNTSEKHSFAQKSSQSEQLTNVQYFQLNKLAALSFHYVQLEEAFGRTPTLQEFGSSTFAEPSAALHAQIHQAWQIFSSAIDKAKRAFPVPTGNDDLFKNVPSTLKPETTRANAKPEAESIKTAPSPTIRPNAQPNQEIISKLPPASRPIVQLNQEIISKLQVESKQLQDRLIVEEDEAKKQVSFIPMTASVPLIPQGRETLGTPPEVDEDWQIIVQQWQPEHWDILQALCLEQFPQLTTAERKDRRPVSRLIDEINAPVDEQLGDLLIDPDTQTLSPHLRVITKHLVSWYYSSKGR